jgi:hypothetical protein
MMLHKAPVLLVPFVLLCPTISHGEQSGPSNFDECIIDAMRGVSSDVAARAIIDSCRNLFLESKPESVPQASSAPATEATPVPVPAPTAVDESVSPVAAATSTAALPPATPVAPPPLDTTGVRALTADELARLGAKAKVFGASYRVTVDNGNPNLTLTEVTIAVWDDTDLGATREEYSEAVQIAPQTSAMVKYTVHYRGDETGWNWGVVAARGVE